MARLQAAREGERVCIRNSKLIFSFWPMKKSARRYCLQARVFSAYPWAVIRNSINDRCHKKLKLQALAFLEQAIDYYNAATSVGITASKPVLLYYCFLNIAKAYILTYGKRNNLDNARHGLSEQKKGVGFANSYLETYPSNANNINVFDDFLSIIKGRGLPKGKKIQYCLGCLIPQIVTGHRLWCSAVGKNEKFVAIESINFIENKERKEVWLRIFIPTSNLSRFCFNRRQVLKESGLEKNWSDVKVKYLAGDINFEQKIPLKYTHRASDVIPDLVGTIKNDLWTIINRVPPYRKYYLHLTSQKEKDQVLPQELSLYALAYYFGSVTRYRPHEFSQMLDGKYGAWIQEFINDFPAQLLYMLASEFCQREVCQAGIV